MGDQIDTSRSLQDLTGEDWGEPSFDSYVVRTCHAARRIPLRDLTIEHLRLLVDQQISPDILIPQALAILEVAPRAGGDFYPGDLLEAVCRQSDGFWDSQPDLFQRVRNAVISAMKDGVVDNAAARRLPLATRTHRKDRSDQGQDS